MQSEVLLVLVFAEFGRKRVTILPYLEGKSTVCNLSINQKVWEKRLFVLNEKIEWGKRKEGSS